MEIFILYVFFNGLIYTAWLWDLEDPFYTKLFNILFGLINGWYVTPIIIGRVIRQIYDE